jgi:hypothetical protein
MLFDLNDLMPQTLWHTAQRNCTEAALVTNPLSCQEVADSAPRSSFSQTCTVWL